MDFDLHKEMDEASGTDRRGFVAYCAVCREDQVFVHTRVAHGQHLLLTLLSAGLWLIVWIVVCVGKSLRPWRCEGCGWHKPEFRRARAPVLEPPGGGIIQLKHAD